MHRSAARMINCGPSILMMTILCSARGPSHRSRRRHRLRCHRQFLTWLHRSPIIAGRLVQRLIVDLAQSFVVLGIGSAGGSRYPGRDQRHARRAQRRERYLDRLLLHINPQDRLAPAGSRSSACRSSSCCRRPRRGRCRRPRATSAYKRLAREADDVGPSNWPISGSPAADKQLMTSSAPSLTRSRHARLALGLRIVRAYRSATC